MELGNKTSYQFLTKHVIWSTGVMYKSNENLWNLQVHIKADWDMHLSLIFKTWIEKDAVYKGV